MTKIMTRILGVIFCLAWAVNANGQAPPAAAGGVSGLRVSGDVYLGGGSIGFNPDVDFGGSVEFAIPRTRIELDAGAWASPLTKRGYHGYTLVGDGRILLEITPKVSGFIGVRPSYVTFGPNFLPIGGTQKHAFNALVGVSIRDHWNPQMPGRFNLAYEQEIGGCVWATATNPCPITSAEFLGARIEQGFDIGRFNFGIQGAFGRVNLQINPNCRACGPIYGFAGQVDLVVRFFLVK